MKFPSICGYLIGWGLLILCWLYAWTLGEVHAVITHYLNLKCGKESPQKGRLNEGLIYGEVRCRWAPNVRFTHFRPKSIKNLSMKGFTSKWLWLRLPPNPGDLKFPLIYSKATSNGCQIRQQTSHPDRWAWILTPKPQQYKGKFHYWKTSCTQ